MKTSELSDGAVVFVVLPYEGGRGWATVDALNVASEPPNRARTVRVSFLPGDGPAVNRTRLVRPHDIVRKRTQDEEDQSVDARSVEALDRLLDFALLPDHIQELGERLQRERDRFRAALGRIAAGDFPPSTAGAEMQRIALAAIQDSTVTRDQALGAVRLSVEQWKAFTEYLAGSDVTREDALELSNLGDDARLAIVNNGVVDEVVLDTAGHAAAV